MTKEEFLNECGYDFADGFIDWLFSNKVQPGTRDYITSDIDVIEVCEESWLAGRTTGTMNALVPAKSN